MPLSRVNTAFKGFGPTPVLLGLFFPIGSGSFKNFINGLTLIETTRNLYIIGWFTMKL